jgi:hypothetical protein
MFTGFLMLAVLQATSMSSQANDQIAEPTAVPGSAPSMKSNVVSDFLHAADRNDFPTMRALLASDDVARQNKALTAENLVKKVSDCYLRRVYGNNETGEVIAAWMCAEGPNKSRVLIADVGRTTDNKILVIVGREDRNQRPAPARTGSAFAD